MLLHNKAESCFLIKSCSISLLRKILWLFVNFLFSLQFHIELPKNINAGSEGVAFDMNVMITLVWPPMPSLVIRRQNEIQLPNKIQFARKSRTSPEALNKKTPGAIITKYILQLHQINSPLLSKKGLRLHCLVLLFICTVSGCTD